MIKKIIKTVKNEGVFVFVQKVKNKLFPTFIIDEVAVVADLLLLKNKKMGGVMIDVGAHYGSALSKFVEQGWFVYAFEPDVNNRANLKKRFTDVKNLSIDERACSNKDNEKVFFYSSEESTGISSLNNFTNGHKVQGEVLTVTLSSFIKEKKIQSVDFLKIDTEGFDLFVLQGFPFENIHPEVIVCEFEDKKTTRLGYSKEDMAIYLQERGYDVIVSLWHPIVRYGISHSWKDYFLFGKQNIDTKEWGNFIAVNKKRTSDLINIFEKHKEKHKRSNK